MVRAVKVACNSSSRSIFQSCSGAAVRLYDHKRGVLRYVWTHAEYQDLKNNENWKTWKLRRRGNWMRKTQKRNEGFRSQDRVGWQRHARTDDADDDRAATPDKSDRFLQRRLACLVSHCIRPGESQHVRLPQTSVEVAKQKNSDQSNGVYVITLPDTCSDVAACCYMGSRRYRTNLNFLCFFSQK